MKSKALFILLIAVIGVTVYFSYIRFIVVKDFVTHNSEEELEVDDFQMYDEMIIESDEVIDSEVILNENE